jgi:hypothetical protein
MAMRPMALVVLWLLLLCPSIASAQVQEVWSARYGRPGNSTDAPGDMAIDAAGNVYVTGSVGISSPWDYATVKYDAAGNESWSATYDGPLGSFDASRAIAVDTVGNVYVTGESVASTSTGSDYLTIKYDPNGNQLWIARFDGPGHGADSARAIAIDQSGNVYVTGNSAGQGDDLSNYATVKYDGNGNQLWVAYYDGPRHAFDAGRALVLDGAGDVYVTGESAGFSGLFDYATVKYDSAGNAVWSARHSDPAGDSHDTPTAITVDEAGCVYVTGASGTTGAGRTYATVKYDPGGLELWVNRYGPPNSSGALARALVVDAGGNVYVTGSLFEEATDFDWATVKYDPNGQEQWISRYNGPANAGDSAFDIALDANGHVYVSGSDFTIIKHDAQGNALWIQRYNGPAGAGRDATNLRVAAEDNVYVSGTSFAPETGLDWLTVRYDRYEPPTSSFVVSVTKAGIGSGRVTSQPDGIVCGGDCNQSYLAGTSVTLTAAPNLGSIFTGWEGCDTATGETCRVMVGRERSVTARFVGVGLPVLGLKP